MTVAPVYGVWPVSATVIVYRTADPGVVVLELAAMVMVRAGVRTPTVAVQLGSVPAAGQLFPAAAEVTVLTRDLSPVSGLFTVTEKVMIAMAPGARSPVQVRSGLA